MFLIQPSISAPQLYTMNNLTHFLLDIHSKFVYLATLSSANTMDINTSLKNHDHGHRVTG